MSYLHQYVSAGQTARAGIVLTIQPHFRTPCPCSLISCVHWRRYDVTCRSLPSSMDYEEDLETQNGHEKDGSVSVTEKDYDDDDLNEQNVKDGQNINDALKNGKDKAEYVKEIMIMRSRLKRMLR